MLVDRKCQNKKCGIIFKARSADVKRGWGRYCCKSCKATAQEARTGQYSNFIHRPNRVGSYRGEETFSDAHLFSNEEHDCNKGDD